MTEYVEESEHTEKNNTGRFVCNYLRNIRTESNNPLSAILEEDPQTLALILASLSPQQGVLILSALSPYKQYDVIRRIALMDRTDPDVMEITKAVLGSKQLSSSKDDYAVIDGVDSVAGLLNIADLGTKNNVLERLKAKDPELAYEIRLKTISFADLLFLDDDAVKRVLNDQDDDVIAFALKGARDEEQSFIFNNLSEERAKAIGKQMAIMGAVHMRDVEKAEQNIADTIIKRGYNAEIASIWMQRQPDCVAYNNTRLDNF